MVTLRCNVLESAVSDLDGPYSGRIFTVFDHVRQQPDFAFSDEYRLLGLKQFVIDATMVYPWDNKNMRVEVPGGTSGNRFRTCF